MVDCGYRIYGGFCRTASHVLTVAGLPSAEQKLKSFYGPLL